MTRQSFANFVQHVQQDLHGIALGEDENGERASEFQMACFELSVELDRLILLIDGHSIDASLVGIEQSVITQLGDLSSKASGERAWRLDDMRGQVEGLLEAWMRGALEPPAYTPTHVSLEKTAHPRATRCPECRETASIKESDEDLVYAMEP